MDEFIDKDGYVYCEIRKVVYGLNEAGCVAFQNLVKNLAPFGYEKCRVTQDYGVITHAVQHSPWK